MNYGFLRVAAATPHIVVANCKSNADNIIQLINDAEKTQVSLIIFPELSITGYTCGDLFLHRELQDAAINELFRIIFETASTKTTAVVGLPLAYNNAIYNVAAIFSCGKLLGIVPKSGIPNYAEFYERRYFSSALSENSEITLFNKNEKFTVPFGTNLLFCDNTTKQEISFAIEICEDMWLPLTPSTKHCMAGALIIGNLSASNEIIGKAEYRKMLALSLSARLACAYIYADSGEGESTTDVVFAGHNLILENGSTLAESQLFSTGLIISDIDIERLTQERQKTTSYALCVNNEKDIVKNETYKKVFVNLQKLDFSQKATKQPLFLRQVEATPFIPQDKENLFDRCSKVLELQSAGLEKRLQHIHGKTAVIGLSGGLDSTLALLVTVKAFKNLNLPLNGITAITMPCFGTTDRTYKNAVSLAKELGITLREISIEKAVMQHFIDIGHNPEDTSITYENSQARERTQILMDVANQVNGIVIGTGDMSELALGWATYNGDHMSMYAVNVSVPKTLVKYLVQFWANSCDGILHKVLQDILDTPVSPELLPPKDGIISQKTEKIVGPYELHDFFLYYTIRWGFSSKKIYFLARKAFKNKYDDKIILDWLKIFYKRFFSQQFKRSCLPDGPKVGSVSLSPRGDWRMPSDADSFHWINELETGDF